MRIGCLQFAPKVGDIDNNLNRADAVLNKAPDLGDLDLLVLPELAFTGYNFASLAHISPFLEPSGSGISALWARTTALKLNCNVVVGYPEKVDVSPKWPTSPEFYNSAILVGRDGETLANYRKSFLYVIDESWALEGQDGFFEGELPDLGNVAMGICMDLNPYKFTAPWHAFEFAFHILEVEANLVILTMAWLTREDARSFTQLPHEPDLETLEYWIQRLEPVIRRETDDEIVVVFCNRTGVEDDAVYAGTSTVIGIKNGEVNLYGILGRGVKELLVVDTARKPFAKLIKDAAGEEVSAGNNGSQELAHPSSQTSGQPSPLSPARLFPTVAISPGASRVGARSNVSPVSPAVGHYSSPNPSPMSSGRYRENISDAASVGSRPSVKSQKGDAPAETPRLELQVPGNIISNTNGASSPQSQAGTDDIPTPTAPSPTPMSIRPKFPHLESTSPVTASGTVIPNSVNMKGGASIVRVNRADTPITPTVRFWRRDQILETTPAYDGTLSEGPPSPPTDEALGLVNMSTIPPRRAVGSLVNAKHACLDKNTNATTQPEPAIQETRLPSADVLCQENNTTRTTPITSPEMVERKKLSASMGRPKQKAEDVADPSGSEEPRAGHDYINKKLDELLEAYRHPSPTSIPTRPASTKSRNASATRMPTIVSQVSNIGRRSTSQSRMDIPIVASPSIFSTENTNTASTGPQPVIYFRPESSTDSLVSTERQSPETQDTQNLHGSSPAGKDSPIMSLPSSGSAGLISDQKPVVDTNVTGNAATAGAAIQRPVSRGRQPFTKTNPTNGEEDHPQPNRQQPSSTSTEANARWRATSTSSSISWVFGSPPPVQLPNSIDPDDEIIAMISFIDRNCPVHKRAGSAPPNQRQSTQDEQASVRGQAPSSRRPSHSSVEGQAGPSHATTQLNHAHHFPETRGQLLQAKKDQSIYEVLLPPHIRDLINSLSSPDSRALELMKSRHAPKFNPPTPTAMQFPENGQSEGKSTVCPPSSVDLTLTAEESPVEDRTLSLSVASSPIASAPSVSTATSAVTIESAMAITDSVAANISGSVAKNSVAMGYTMDGALEAAVTTPSMAAIPASVVNSSPLVVMPSPVATKT